MNRVAARIITSVIAFAVAAELVALAAYYVDTGALFYVHRKAYPEPLPTPEDRLVVREAVHPYFGFTHAPGTPYEIPETLRAPGVEPPRRTTNNYGFVSAHAYPFRRTRDDQVVVGLFGGSVGVFFCELGAPRLLEALKRDAWFRDREIVPLCFSHEGYKQPQQALVLAYFLAIGQTFDLVVNIDGFNDVALATLNAGRGLESAMPSVQHMDPLVALINQSALTPDKLDSLSAIVSGRRRLTELTARMRSNRIATVNAVLERMYQRGFDDYTRQLGRFSNLPSNPPANALVQVATAPKDASHAPSAAALAATWTSGSRLMHDMLTARGAAYVHVLQPNQYWTRRRFSEAEAAVALNEASPYRNSVAEAYPALVAAAKSDLTARGVAFLDATGVFDDEPSPVYLDNCCHYTRVGNERLADVIAQSILGAAGPWR
ncbi:MAG: hypothetical protein FJW14_18945 [Acidimicrobiia bacterium]|nr:hypothetical protein [Acidimicrobiia bacterium]